jgi:hypothetical protein
MPDEFSAQPHGLDGSDAARDAKDDLASFQLVAFGSSQVVGWVHCNTFLMRGEY